MFRSTHPRKEGLPSASLTVPTRMRAPPPVKARSMARPLEKGNVDEKEKNVRVEDVFSPVTLRVGELQIVARVFTRATVVQKAAYRIEPSLTGGEKVTIGNFCSLFSSHLGFSGGGGGAAGGGLRTPVLPPPPPLPAASAVALTFTDGVSPAGVLLGACAGSAFVPAPDGAPGRAIGVLAGCVGVVAAVPVGRRFSVVAVRRSWRGEERKEQEGC